MLVIPGIGDDALNMSFGATGVVSNKVEESSMGMIIPGKKVTLIWSLLPVSLAELTVTCGESLVLRRFATELTESLEPP